MTKETWLGQIITVINKKPFKFSVKLIDLTADSGDPLNRIPKAFIFDDGSDQFVVKVTSSLIMFWFPNNDVEVMNKAILFGLISKRSRPDEKEFVFTTEEWEALRSKKKLQGQELKQQILNFFYSVNMEWPDQGISVYDLLDNFDNSKEELQDWVRTLDEAELLMRKTGFTSFRENRGHVNAHSWKINLKYLSQIELIIKSKSQNQLKNENLKVFLSYSSLDRILAGKVKSELVKYGVNVFLAHEDIEPSEEWINIIQENLDTCHVFIILLTQNSKISSWVDQESGQAYNKGTLIIPLKINCDPYGFLGKFQALTLHEDLVESAGIKIITKIEDKFKIKFQKAS
ncbi:MAG TPA: toll/interleukin-1 receptor domain-containing protein [candidate division Zixibacteria bacterium]|nr:toll/interleukin-1 receptor domain-containing protein [candidate division Zixibacteria bacterium]